MPAKPTKITVAWDDGTSQDWVPAAAATPATPLPTPAPPPPTPVPVPTPPVVKVTDPPIPDNAILVLTEATLREALNVAPAGGTIAIRNDVVLRLTSELTIRRANGLTIVGYGEGGTVKGARPTLISAPDANLIGVPKDAALKGLTFRNLVLRPPDRTPGQPGFRDNAKGDGINIMGRVDGLTLDNVDVAYFRQNVAIDASNNPDGCSDVTITGLLSAFAWAVAFPDNDNRYLGQGLYLDSPRGPITVKDSAFVHNGWHETLPPHARSQFRHGIYCQKTSAAPIVTGCGFIDNASFGAQLRPGGTLDGCYFQGNAFAACSFKPSWIVRSSAILATGGRHWTGSGYIGNGCLYSWADVLAATNTALVYVQQPAPSKADGEYDAAAITLSRDYAAHPDWASQSPQLSAVGVTVRGFAQLADYPGKVEPASIPGVTVRPGAVARPAWVDSAGPDLLAGRTSVASLVDKAKALAGG